MFPGVEGASLFDLFEKVLKLFALRQTQDGTSMLSTFFAPAYEDPAAGWFRLGWRAFEEIGGIQSLPAQSWSGGPSSWQIAWHVTKMEMFYCTAYHGYLFASRNEDLGHRIHDGQPGIYCHNDETCVKVQHCFCSMPLFSTASSGSLCGSFKSAGTTR